MKKIKVQVIKLGKQKNEAVFKKLKKYKSEIFEISIFEKSRPNCDCGWGYSFDTLKNLLIEDFKSNEFDLCIGFVDTEIENNFFGKRLDKNNLYVISFYEVDNILKNENISIFNYMITTIYRYVTRYILKGKYLTHDETRGCIFDMCGYKNDVVYSCQQPIVCNECISKIKESLCPDNYLKILNKELSKVRKTFYYKISDFIKLHPLISVIIGIATTIILNLLSSTIYDIVKKVIVN